MDQLAHGARILLIGLAWIPPLAYYRELRAWKRIAPTHAGRLADAQSRLAEARRVQDICRRAESNSASADEVRFASETLDRWNEEIRERTRQRQEEFDAKMAALKVESEARAERHDVFMERLQIVSNLLDLLPGASGGAGTSSVGRNSSSTTADDTTHTAIRIYEGHPYGSAILTLVGRHVFEGSSVRGAPLYTVRGNQLFRGASEYGVPLATVSNNRVFEGGASAGAPLATISGNKVFAGAAAAGPVAVSASESDSQALLAGAYHQLA